MSGNKLLDPGDKHGQGDDLLGLGIDESNKHFALVDQFDATQVTAKGGEPVIDVSIKALALTGRVRQGSFEDSLSGTDWNGAVMQGKLHCRNKGLTANATLRIRSVTQRPADEVNGGSRAAGLSWVYDLELWREDVGKWVNACRDANDVAFPIPGYWDQNANYDRDKNIFSFACIQRDVAKCMRHDYLDDDNQHGDEVKLFEACTRMMRADYCGDGNSYTKDGTIVSAWDNRNNAQPRHIKPPLSFAAAWRSDGVACFNRPRWDEEGLGRPLPACLKSKPHCTTAEEAKSMFTNKVLVFEESCKDHPCTVTFGETHTETEEHLKSASTGSPMRPSF